MHVPDKRQASYIRASRPLMQSSRITVHTAFVCMSFLCLVSVWCCRERKHTLTKNLFCGKKQALKSSNWLNRAIHNLVYKEFYPHKQTNLPRSRVKILEKLLMITGFIFLRAGNFSKCPIRLNTNSSCLALLVKYCRRQATGRKFICLFRQSFWFCIFSIFSSNYFQFETKPNH